MRWISGDPLGYQNWKVYQQKVETIKHYWISGKPLHKVDHSCAQPLDLKLLRGLNLTQLSFGEENICTLLLLMNMANPGWILIQCYKRLLNHLVCYKKQADQTTQNYTAPFAYCNVQEIQLRQNCLQLKLVSHNWLRQGQSHFLLDKCLPVQEIQQYKLIAKSSLLSSPSTTLVLCQNKIRFQNPRRHLNLFQCKNIAVSLMLVCDGNNDCTQRESADKASCECITSSAQIYPSAKGNTCDCRPLYHKNKQGHCVPYFYQQSTNQTKTKQFLSTDITYTTGSNTDSCSFPYILKCTQEDRDTCFDIPDLCSFKLSNKGDLLPCRQGSHLENCDNFVCNMMFKCQSHYCIPLAYVCNGKWDCPLGLDEPASVCEQNRNCSGMFKCKKFNICLHLGNTCDVNTDCPSGDDENLCLLSSKNCPLACTCLAFGIICSKLSIVEAKNLKQLPFIFVHLSISYFSNVGQILTYVPLIKFFLAHFLGLKSICGSYNRRKQIVLIDNSHNYIEGYNMPASSIY